MTAMVLVPAAMSVVRKVGTVHEADIGPCVKSDFNYFATLEISKISVQKLQ